MNADIEIMFPVSGKDIAVRRKSLTAEAVRDDMVSNVYILNLYQRSAVRFHSKKPAETFVHDVIGALRRGVMGSDPSHGTPPGTSKSLRFGGRRRVAQWEFPR